MKNLLLLFLTVASMSVSAQINVIKPQEKEEPKEIIQVYDSLMSLNNQNVMQHVGQTLFFRGYTYKDSEWFDCFYKKPSLNYYAENRTKFYPKSIIGRYYLITNVYKYKRPGYDTMERNWVELQDKENGNVMYYSFDGTKGHLGITDANIFVTVGYYEKLKQRYIGKEFYNIRDKVRTYSGEWTSVPLKTKFTCIDFELDLSDRGSINAIVESSEYGKCKACVNEFKINTFYFFIPVSDYDKLSERYGDYVDLILAERIKIGMTKEMVKASWGEPKRINTTRGSFGVQEQWVYGTNSYVYFENGEVTTIQN